MVFAPKGQQRAAQLYFRVAKGDANASRLRTKALKWPPKPLAFGTERAADIDAQERMSVQVDDSQVQPLRIQTAVRQHDDRLITWHSLLELRQQLQPFRFPSVVCCAFSTFHATEIVKVLSKSV